MSLNRAIRLGISDASQHEASFELIVIKEALIRLVNRTSRDLARTGRARPCTTGIRQVDALLFSSVENVLVIRNFDGLIKTLALIDQRDFVRSHGMEMDGNTQNPRSCKAPESPLPTSAKVALVQSSRLWQEALSKDTHE